MVRRDVAAQGPDDPTATESQPKDHGHRMKTYAALSPWREAAPLLAILADEQPDLLALVMREPRRAFHIRAWWLQARALDLIGKIGASATASHFQDRSPRELLSELHSSPHQKILWRTLKRAHPFRALSLDQYEAGSRWCLDPSMHPLIDSIPHVMDPWIAVIRQLEVLPLAAFAYRSVLNNRADDFLTILSFLMHAGIVQDTLETRANLLAMRNAESLGGWVQRQMDDLRAPELLRIPNGLPLTQLASVRDLRLIAIRFHNCIARNAVVTPNYLQAFIDGDLFLVWTGTDTPVLIHLDRFGKDYFSLSGAFHPDNQPCSAPEAEQIVEALRLCGIDLVAGDPSASLSAFL